MGYQVPSELFQMLAQAKAQPDDWSKDITAAAGAGNNIAGAIKGYRDQQNANKLDKFFSMPVPADTLSRIIPGAPTDGSVTYRDLAGLSNSGLSTLLKDPNTVDLSTALSLAGRTGGLAGIFGDNAAPTKVNTATIAAAKALKPATPRTPRGGSMSPEVNTLKALQGQYAKQLGGDISEGDRSRIQKNLDAVNNRLARIGGVTLDNTPAPAAPPLPAAAAKAAAPAAAPAAQSTSGAIQALLKALSS